MARRIIKNKIEMEYKKYDADVDKEVNQHQNVICIGVEIIASSIPLYASSFTYG